ncbi:MAG: hypothetical protein IJ749_06150 [Eubacterium sp.]|nr:hypothetical protein [Eubacterium sp.]
MNANIVMVIISVLLKLLMGYEIGDMTANALEYTTTRGQAFKDGFIILGCIIVQLILDKMLLNKVAISKEDSEEDAENGFSPIVLDTAIYLFGTILIVVFLGMLGSKTISVTLATMLISIVIMLIVEKEIYIDRRSGMTFDEVEKEENEEDENESSQKNDKSKFAIFSQLSFVLSKVTFAAIGVLALGNLQWGNFGGPYYLIIFLCAALTILFRFMDRVFASMAEEITKKDNMIGFILSSLIFAIFLAFFSKLAGFVWLLAAVTAKVIVPVAFDNWGKGGTEKVNKNKVLISRLTNRIFALIIVMIAVWFLSFGAVWEIEYLAMIAVALTLPSVYINWFLPNCHENDKIT